MSQRIYNQAPRARALPVVRRLLRGTRERRWSAYGTLICLLCEAAVENAAIPVLLALVFLSIAPSPAALGKTVASDWIQRLHWVGSADPDARLRSLFIFAILMLGAWFTKSVFTFGRNFLSQHFSQQVIRDLRQRLYDHLVRQSLSFYRARESGELQSRVSNDVVILQRLLGSDLLEGARAPIAIAISLTLMASLEWRLTLLALCCVPGISFIIARSGERLRQLAREVQHRLGRLNAFLHERLAGVETVQLFGMENREVETFQEINASNYRINMRVATAVAMLVPLVELISAFGMLILIFVAGYLTIKGPLSLPTLVAFAYAGQSLGSKLSLLGKLWLSTQQAAAAGDRIFEILDTHEEVPEAPDAVALPRVRGQIAFRQVSFQYRQGEAVLRDLNLIIEPGQMVALVGASGAGKTSLANLLPRFYDPSTGRIEIDGINIAAVTLVSLRSQIGIVPQEPILFSGSIRENIAYGQPGATPEQIQEAAQAANAHDFISALPSGYDTSVGERAARLSGGQRQRIAIARTLLRDPRLLILDEATSALDAESETLVQNALERLMEGRTTLIIAHRLSTIQRADRILVLSEGRIVEDGTHDQLFAMRGCYRRLYEAQLSGPRVETSAVS